MVRSIAFAVALAFASVSFTGVADAGHHKHKLCKAKTLKGKKVTFKCKADQRCCYSKLLNKGTCGSKKLPMCL
ncbi:MAG: hypothetical protein RIC14_04470 [Filomicrobium sp.]